MLVIDKQKILDGLEMDNDYLVEGNACEIIYLRDQLIAVIKYEGAVSPLEFRPDQMIARLEGISCWIPVCEVEAI